MQRNTDITGNNLIPIVRPYQSIPLHKVIVICLNVFTEDNNFIYTHNYFINHKYRDGCRDQIVTSDMGGSLHSKTPPLFMKYNSAQCHPYQYLSLFPVLFLQSLYMCPLFIHLSPLLFYLFQQIACLFISSQLETELSNVRGEHNPYDYLHSTKYCVPILVSLLWYRV